MAALASGAALGLQSVDQIDNIEESASGTTANAGTRKRIVLTVEHRAAAAIAGITSEP